MFVYKKTLVLFLLVWAGILSTHPDLVFSIHQPRQIEIQESSEWVQVPTQIIFASGKSLPIEEKSVVDGDWQVAEYSVSHLSSSSIPGQFGNIILYSHNYPELFGMLKNIEIGQKFSLKTTGGTQFEYRILSKIQVDPDQVEWLESTEDEVVTLYTCDGLLDQKRLVVRAVRVGV